MATVACTITDGADANNVGKFNSGTLILSGDNDYTGSTTIYSGTLIAMGPESLPGYDVQDKVNVMDIGVPLDEYSGTTDAHSTLVVQADATGDNGWTAQEIHALLPHYVYDWEIPGHRHDYTAVFEHDTNFGITVADGATFDFGGEDFQLYDITYDITNSESDPRSHVGFVKLGAGTLDFGTDFAAGLRVDRGTGYYFLGPFTIYDGTLRASQGNPSYTMFPVNRHHDADSGQPYLAGISLHMTDAATLDLNAYDQPSTRCQVSEFHGENGARITDNSEVTNPRPARSITRAVFYYLVRRKGSLPIMRALLHRDFTIVCRA